MTAMVLKQSLYLEEIENLKRNQVHQNDLQSKLRLSEKTRLELLSSLCESEATIKRLKIDSMKFQEEQQNSIIRERKLIEDNDKMWSSRLKLLQENYEKDKESLVMKLDKEQQMNSEKEKLRLLMQRSNSDNLRSASDIENSLPAKIPPHQNFQSVTAPQKQGESQATKKPRANTPNTSRKFASNSLQVAAVNSVKNHILKLPNDTDSDDFVVQNPVQIADESLSWNQVTGMIAGRHDD